MIEYLRVALVTPSAMRTESFNAVLGLVLGIVLGGRIIEDLWKRKEAGTIPWKATAEGTTSTAKTTQKRIM